jgi:hypothetical protein
MQIIKREMTDTCEGLPVTLICRDALPDAEILKTKELVESWPIDKGRIEGLPPEYHPRLQFSPSEDRRSLRFLAYWFPQEWYTLLAAYLEAILPFVERLELGCDFEPPFHDDHAYIHVPQKLVELEGGTLEVVPSFEIAKYPVSVGQYDRFVQMSGYVTRPEQIGSEYCFRLNPGWEQIPPTKRVNLPAAYLCFPDVTAYCDWAKARLPSEAEWLAASIIDETVFETHDEAGDRRAMLLQHPDALAELRQEEFTGTVVEGRAVVRQGPYIVRHAEASWNKYDRRLASQREFGPIQFRVCTVNSTNSDAVRDC